MSEQIQQLPMIGSERQDILNAICQKIEQHWGKREVICLHGPGGIGKTRMLKEIIKTYHTLEKRELNITDAHSYRLVLVQQDGRGEWSAEFLAGVTSMANEFSIHLDFRENDAMGDLNKMEELLRKAIAQQPDALLVRGNLNDSSRELINRTVQAVLPVLTFNNYSSGIDHAVIKIKNEEAEGIKQAAFNLRDRLNYQGDVAIFRENTPLHKNRAALFQHFLYNYPDIHIVADETLSCQPDEIKRHIEDIRRRFPQLRAVWTTCNTFAKVLTPILQDAGIWLSSFDFDQADVELMTRAGSPWYLATSTEPYKGGRVLVRLAMQKILQEPQICTDYTYEPRLIFQEELRNNREAWRSDDDKAWTLKLRSLVDKKKPVIRLLESFDFDERRLRNIDALQRDIAKQLDLAIFESFQQAQSDYFTMRKSGVGIDGLNRQKKAIDEAFCACFNRYAENKRPVLLFDTFDIFEKDIEEEEEKTLFKIILENFENILPRLQNTVIIIAGRQTAQLEQSFRPMLQDELAILEIKPLNLDDCRTYLHQKARQLHISVEDDLAEKLSFLSDGKPILLDLAVDLRGRGIALDWLATDTMEVLHALEQDKAKKARRLQEFERALVKHIAELRKTFDELILLLSHTWPLNKQMIAAMLEISLEDAHVLFERARNFVFIKILPNEFIKLHDEMQRMVALYVQPESDPEYFRLRIYTRQGCSYLTEEIENHAAELLKKRLAFKKLEQDDMQKKDRLDAALEIQELEEALWVMKEQHLRDALFTDFEKGVKLFEESFAEADTLQLCQKLFKIFLKYQENFQASHKIIQDIHQIKLWCNEKEYYQDALNLCQKVLQQPKLAEEQIIDLLILQGNLHIRLGDVEAGINDFQKAVNRSEKGYNEQSLSELWLIKSEKELGWAHRLTGALDKAMEHYRKARTLCLKHDAPKNKFLQYDYGMILNNLAFVLSNDRDTREAAESTAKTAIEHWKKIGHQIGLGAGYIVFGIACYRKGDAVAALYEFDKAVEIFEQVKQTDWLGQVYAWRGATLRVLGRYDEAEKNLKKAFEIGTENMKAMILNRLGRVYMSRGDWKQAEEKLYESFEWAKKIPDYIYGLVSLSRLMMIAAETQQYARLDEFERKLKNYLAEIKEPDENNKGIAYIALARLAFGRNNRENIARIIEYLKNGIRLVTEYGSYANRDGLSRLKIIEKEFDHVESEIIRQVGKALLEEVSEKELKDIHYNSITDMMYSWAHWKEGEV